MSYFSLISTIALSSVLFIIYRIICTYFSLATLPGPFWSRITNLPRVAWVKSGHAHVFHQRLHDVHGRVVRLGPNTVSVSDPDAIPTIYPTREGFPKVRTLQTADCTLQTINPYRVTFTASRGPIPGRMVK